MRLDRFVANSNILQVLNACMEPTSRVTPDLQILLVCMAHWELTASFVTGSAAYYPLSQLLVYRKFASIPLFKNNGGLRNSIVNTKLVLAMIYFWRFQIMSCFNGTMHQNSGEEKDHVKPCAWKRPVFNTTQGVRPLYGKWKGLSGKS